MKKLIALAAAAALVSSAVFAEGFKLSGYLRAGWGNTKDALDTDGDGDGDTAEASTMTWLAGDYFGGKTRSRINLAWSNEGDTAGAYVRLQYTGAAENWKIDTVKYANVWAKPFDGKLLFAAGKVQDNYIKTDGWEGFSFLDANSGFFAGVAPIDGLVIGGGAVVDYLKGFDDDNDTSTADKHRASKRAVYAGAKYTNDQFSVAGAYEFAGALYGGVNITAVDGLLIALEAAWQSGDEDDDVAVDGVTGGYTSELTFVEQVEYTGIENLTLGVESYQFLNDHAINTKEDTLVVTITPAARYEINDLFAASVESTITISDWDKEKVGKKAPDTYATIVPAFHIKATKDAEISIWGLLSTDTDQAKHAAGVGGIFNF